MSCVAFRETVAELALGHVPEPDRSSLLGHAHGCPQCAALLDDLAGLSDRLLVLAPGAEPPVGFEERAVARMQEPSVRTSRRWFAGLASAAAVLTLVVGGLLLTGGDSPNDVRRAAVVDDEGDDVGTLELASAGSSPRLVLTMEGPHDWPGEWICELEVDGRWVEVGRWTADDVAHDVWATGIADDYDDATAMRIRNGRGRVVATADMA